MAFGTGISSNAGQGAEEYPQTIIPEVEEFFSDTSSESESEDDVPLIPGAEQQRHSVLHHGTRARRRLPNAKLDAQFQTLRARRRFPNGELDEQFQTLRAILRPTIRRVPVEVLRDPLQVNGQLKLKIACANRSGLLLGLIAALDLKCLFVLDGSFDCRRGSVLFANLCLEKHNRVTPVDAGSEPRPQPLPESEEDEALKESILCVIRQDTSAGTSDNISN